MGCSESEVRTQANEPSVAKVNQQGGVSRQRPDRVGLPVLLRSLAHAAHHGARARVHVHPVERIAERIRDQDIAAGQLAHGLNVSEVFRENGFRGTEWCGLGPGRAIFAALGARLADEESDYQHPRS